VTNEAFARIKIDQLLKDTDWRLTDGISVRYEYPLDDGGRADYALFDRQGRALAVLEAKSTSVSLSAGETQGRRYADLLDVPFIFLSNGEEIWFCDKGQDAHSARSRRSLARTISPAGKPPAISAAAHSTSQSIAGLPAVAAVCIRAHASRRYAERSSTGGGGCWSKWRPAQARRARRRR